MLQLLSLFLAAFAWVTLAVPYPNVNDTSIAPWTTLGINIDDAARFATSGVSPVEGADIITTEEALFNGTHLNLVPGAYSAATAMGMGDTADGVNLKLVVVVGWRRDRACSYDDEQRLDNIYYNRGMNSYVGIKVASYEIPTGLRPLFINTLWGVFKEITECDVSRYQLRGWKNHEACREFANSADQIEVRLENSRGPNEKPGTFTDPHLRVQIAFNGKTDEGQFDCVGTQASIWDQVRQRMVPEIAKKYNDAQVDFDVVCVTPRVDGNCNSVICKSDSRWTDKPGFEGEDGSCHWHNKCSTPDHCIFSL